MGQSGIETGVVRPDGANGGLGEATRVTAANERLTQSLLELIDQVDQGVPHLSERLSALEKEYGQEVFAQLLSILCHLQFDPPEALMHWNRILEHHATLESKWEGTVDLRVALASYFIQVHRRLQSPTIMEMRLFEQTRAYAYRDELTGLRNYRFFEFYLFQELQRSDQYAWPLSLLMLDVDDFKGYNDAYGHEAGNAALIEIGRLVAESCRKVDVPARYGGEEFAVVIPATPKIGAQMAAERIRERVESHPWTERQITVSVGVATYPGDAVTPKRLIRCADQALYRAKERGKNQVSLYGESRRSHRRIQVALDGKLYVPGVQALPLTTVDVSEGGVRFRSAVELPREALIDVRLSLPGTDDEIVLATRVVMSKPLEAVGFDSAARVVDISTTDRRALTRYLQGLEVDEPS